MDVVGQIVHGQIARGQPRFRFLSRDQFVPIANILRQGLKGLAVGLGTFLARRSLASQAEKEVLPAGSQVTSKPSPVNDIVRVKPLLFGGKYEKGLRHEGQFIARREPWGMPLGMQSAAASFEAIKSTVANSEIAWYANR
jgi:hypothetical protein